MKLVKKDGERVSYEELKNFCFELSLNYTETQYKEFFESFSLSDSKMITRTEFNKLVDYCIKKNA